jgi:hypothetical protein
MKQELATTIGHLRDIIAVKFLRLTMSIMHDENAKITIALINHQIFTSALKGS